MAGSNDDMEGIITYSPLKKPSLIELPKLVRKSKASEFPGLIEGFRGV